jgi:hypothetical protein
MRSPPLPGSGYNSVLWSADHKDAAFLALAHAAGAWVATGNLKHSPANARLGVIVLPPADYLAHLGVK